MKHDKKAMQSINKLCASWGMNPVYSNIFPSATATVTGKHGIAMLDGPQMKRILACPYFSCIRAGFVSGTLTIEFQTLG